MRLDKTNTSHRCLDRHKDRGHMHTRSQSNILPRKTNDPPSNTGIATLVYLCDTISVTLILAPTAITHTRLLHLVCLLVSTFEARSGVVNKVTERSCILIPTRNGG